MFTGAKVNKEISQIIYILLLPQKTSFTQA